MNIKNYLLGVALLAGAHLVNAYDATIVNSTDGKIVVFIERARPDICAPLVVMLESHTQHTFNTGSCCMGDFIIEKTQGSRVGAKFTYQPPFTNSDMTCASVAIKVTDVPNENKIRADKI